VQLTSDLACPIAVMCSQKLHTLCPIIHSPSGVNGGANLESEIGALKLSVINAQSVAQLDDAVVVCATEVAQPDSRDSAIRAVKGNHIHNRP